MDSFPIFSVSWQCAQVVFVWLFHSYCLHRLYHRKTFSPILLIIQFLILLDIIEITITKPHNILCEVYREEIFPWWYLDVLVFIVLFRWYCILTLLPVVGALTVVSLVDPMFYRNRTRKWSIQVVMVVSMIPIGLTAPQYFDCCGYRFYMPGYYFTFDMDKASYVYYITLNWVLQIFCLAFSCLSDLYLMYYVYQHRRKNNRQSIMVTNVSSKDVTKTSNGKQQSHNRLSPNVRLALSFVMFSGGFILGTVSYNFLSRLPPSMFIKVLNLVFNQSQYIKFGAYAFLPKG